MPETCLTHSGHTTKKFCWTIAGKPESARSPLPTQRGHPQPPPRPTPGGQPAVCRPQRFLTGAAASGVLWREHNQNIASPVDHRSFRDQLAFSIGFAVTRSRALLRRLLKEHAPDDARQQLADQVVEHLEQSGFEIDEGEQVMRKRPPSRNHG